MGRETETGPRLAACGALGGCTVGGNNRPFTIPQRTVGQIQESAVARRGPPESMRGARHRGEEMASRDPGDMQDVILKALYGSVGSGILGGDSDTSASGDN